MSSITNDEENRFRKFVACPWMSYSQKDNISEKWAKTLMKTVDIVKEWEIDWYKSYDSLEKYTSKKLTFNKYAESEIKGILQEITKLGPEKYKIVSLGCYDYRTVSGTKSLSMHAFGLAMDINAHEKVNPWFDGRNIPAGEKDTNTKIRTESHPVVNIFKKHNWKWGGSYGDTMHFSFCGH